MIQTTQRSSTPRWTEFSRKNFWPISRSRHLSYAWRVRIFTASIYFANWCPTGMHKHDQPCTDLIETTANALTGGAVTLMLLSVQKDNLELNIKRAVEWYVPMYNGTKIKAVSCNHRTHDTFQEEGGDRERVLKTCIMIFPSIWVSGTPCPLALTKNTAT